MTEAVLDASVVLKWFRREGERHVPAARSLRTEFEAGRLLVFAPPLLFLEIVNAAARRWHFDETALSKLATALSELAFELREPDLSGIARWTARGLTASDAAYVALAEVEAIRLVTDDELILKLAPTVAVALGSGMALL